MKTDTLYTVIEAMLVMAIIVFMLTGCTTVQAPAPEKKCKDLPAYEPRTLITGI